MLCHCSARVSSHSFRLNVAQVDPIRGNVAFASAQSGWSFTLHSFAQLYADVCGVAFDTKEFARRLWGDVYFHPDSRTFKRKPPTGGAERTFVAFLLEPLYKIYSQVGAAVHVVQL